MILNIQQEQIVPERSARLNLDPVRGDWGDGVMDGHLQEAGPFGCSFARVQPLEMIKNNNNNRGDGGNQG